MGGLVCFMLVHRFLGFCLPDKPAFVIEVIEFRACQLKLWHFLIQVKLSYFCQWSCHYAYTSPLSYRNLIGQFYDAMLRERALGA